MQYGYSFFKVAIEQSFSIYDEETALRSLSIKTSNLDEKRFKDFFDNAFKSTTNKQSKQTIKKEINHHDIASMFDVKIG